ncbi:uncharacterized protein LOC134231101 [Saccostrea cucullata]|uniref:uncharacterized protein LOC134231101 n=1 Tax=Saccostrea cuccullata TaxID=36930 RepID=UPI002ED0AFF9
MADEVKIGYLKEMLTLLRKSLEKFVKAMTMKSTKDLTTVPFKDSNSQLNDNIIATDVMKRAYMVDHEDENQPSSLQRAVRKFYYAVTSKMLVKFLFKDMVVSNLGFLNPANGGDLPPTALTVLAQRFASLVPQDHWEQRKDKFIDYQTTPAVDLPGFVEDTRTDVYCMG